MPPTRQHATRSRATRSSTVYELKQELEPESSTAGASQSSATSQELGDLEDAIESEDITPKKKRVASSKKASPSKKKTRPPLATPLKPPPNWEEIYKDIEEMRKGFKAPVDTMGCASLGQVETTDENRRFATLVSLIMSSQTKDESLYKTMKSLREALGGAISVEAVLRTPRKTIFEAIRSLGMGDKKSGYIKGAAEILQEHYNSDVPKKAEQIMSIPGVGPKMAYLCLSIAWKIHEGIGVDVHVHRITNLLGWHGPKGSTNEEHTRVNLESWLPKDKWLDINQQLVGFGQVICLPAHGREKKRMERCDQCTLATKKLCPSRRKTVTSQTAKVRTGIIVEDEEGPSSKIEYEETSITLKEEVS